MSIKKMLSGVAAMGVYPFARLKMRHCAAAVLVAAQTCGAAVLTDGEPFELGIGETFTVTGTHTIPTFRSNGTLTLGDGANLTINDFNNKTSSVIANGAPISSTLNLESGSRLHFACCNPSRDYEVLAVGMLGGTGTVNVAEGAVLSSAGVSSGWRLRLTCNTADNRTPRTYAILNIAGTVDLGVLTMTSFFQNGITDTNLFYRASEVNLLPGGVFSAVSVHANDATISRFNFKGGRLLMRAANEAFFSTSHGALMEIDFADGTTSTIETAGNMTVSQGSFVNISGSGTLVKKGNGLLTMLRPNGRGVNSFTGNIRVEQGSVFLGRALAPGQTVYVCEGASFVNAVPTDDAQVTYENESERPAAGGLFVVAGSVEGGIDLLSSSFDHDRIGGPSMPSINVSVGGTVTHAPASVEVPFTLVGQNASSRVEFLAPGIDAVPLRFVGAGTFLFPGDRDLWWAQADELQFAGGTYAKTGAVSFFTEPGETYRLENGGVAAQRIYVGADGTNADVVVSGGSLSASDAFYVGSSRGDVRHHTFGSLTLTNATVSSPDLIRIGAMGLTGGSSLHQPYGRIVLQKDSKVSANVLLNDEGSAEVIFDGGILQPRKVDDAVFAANQNGLLTVRGTNDNDIVLNMASTTNRLAFSARNKVRFTSDGGGLVFRGKGEIKIEDGEMTADYAGDTVIEGELVRLFADDPFPFGEGKGKVVITGAKSLDLNGRTLSANEVEATLTNSICNSSYDEAVVKVGCDNRDFAWGAQLPDRVKLVKDGTGVMDVRAELPQKLDVAAGTVRTVMPSYRHYRFKIEAVEGVSANSAAIGELKLLNNGVDVTRPYAAVGQAPTGSSPAAEVPAKGVDGNLATKYLDFNGANLEPTGSAEKRDNCWLRLDYDEPVTVTDYTWATGNDLYSPTATACRNPKNWRFQGSTDGLTWIDLDVRTGYTVKNAASSSWIGEVFALGTRSRAGGTVVNVLQGGTLEVEGTLDVSTINSEGRTVLNEGAVLRVAASSDGSCRGNFEGAGVIEKIGGGVLALDVNDGFTGGVAVRGGTVVLGKAVAGKWFRFTVRKTNSGADTAMQFSEFKLLDANGVRQNLNLAMAANGTSPELLQPGSFCKADAYPRGGLNGSEDADKLFDGNTATKWCATGVGELKNGATNQWRTITMRLADDATPIAKFNLTSANDVPARAPSSWLLETSMDGVTWQTIDDRTGVAYPATQFTEFNGGVPFELMASDVEASTLNAKLEVASGAAVRAYDDTTIISALRIDCAAGGGTLDGVGFAENGEIHLACEGDIVSAAELPLSVSNARGAANLRKWKVYVNGELKQGWKVSLSGSGMRLSAGGFVFLIR